MYSVHTVSLNEMADLCADSTRRGVGRNVNARVILPVSYTCACMIGRYISERERGYAIGIRLDRDRRVQHHFWIGKHQRRQGADHM